MKLIDHACPRCGSKNVSASPFESDEDSIWAIADCADCKCEWRWFYSLTGVEILQERVEED